MKTPPLPPMDSKGMKQVMLDKSAQELLDIAKNRLSTSQLRFKDKQNIHRLQKEMDDWEMSQRIRTYVAAMRTTDSATDATDPEFLIWAESYATTSTRWWIPD